MQPGAGYAELKAIPHWRRMFSSLYDAEPFLWEGRTFRSVEHAFQSAKFFSCGKMRAAERFALESGDRLASASALEAHRCRKIEILSPAELAAWEAARHATKLRIYEARFTQGTPARALAATGQAELWSAGPRIGPLRCTTIEEVRGALQAKRQLSGPT